MNAIALFEGKWSGDIIGRVLFHQCSPDSKTTINISLSGFEPYAVHAIHIHEYGDLSKGCESAGGHYNPFNQHHGNWKIHGNFRHAGDLINQIEADKNGNVDVTFADNLVSLYGSHSIYGRTFMIHQDADDLGLSGTEESLKTGTAGKRIACAIIGVAKPIQCSLLE
jgi:Cu-Zn family superoxide dismutase